MEKEAPFGLRRVSGENCGKGNGRTRKKDSQSFRSFSACLSRIILGVPRLAAAGDAASITQLSPGCYEALEREAGVAGTRLLGATGAAAKYLLHLASSDIHHSTVNH